MAVGATGQRGANAPSRAGRGADDSDIGRAVNRVQRRTVRSASETRWNGHHVIGCDARCHGQVTCLVATCIELESANK